MNNTHIDEFVRLGGRMLEVLPDKERFVRSLSPSALSQKEDWFRICARLFRTVVQYSRRVGFGTRSI